MPTYVASARVREWDHQGNGAHRRDDEDTGFNSALQQSKDAVKLLGRTIPAFKPEDAQDDGPLVLLSAELKQQAVDYVIKCFPQTFSKRLASATAMWLSLS